MRDEYLTIPQLKAIRKQLRHFRASGKTKAASTSSEEPRSSSSRRELEPSNDSPEPDAEADEEPLPVYEDQERSSNFDNILVRFKIRPARASI